MKVLRDYQGKPVRLTDERSAHIKEHPEMVDMEAALEETLLKPQLVMRSGADTSATRTIATIMVPWLVTSGYALW
jgi:hypothetical protein